MGCQESRLIENKPEMQLDSFVGKQDFTIAYRQFISNTRGNIFDLYYFTTVLSKSNSRVITKAIHKTNNQLRICKIIPFNKVNHLLAMMEVEILKNLEHPNIIKIHEYFIQKTFLFIVFQFFEGKPILQELKRIKQINHEQIISIIKQILLVISYLQRNQIVHRNLKPSHILIRINKDIVDLRVIDFSNAERINNPKKKKVAKTSTQDELLHTQMVTNPCQNDIYSCGLIFLNILSKNSIKIKRRSESNEIVLKFIKDNPKYQIYSDLLTKMLNPNPRQRITAKEALADPLFQVEKHKQKQKIKIMYENLMEYNTSGRLKEIFWMYATINLNKFITPELIMEFHNLDQNRDGKIDISELSEGIENIYNYDKISAMEEACHIFEKIDKNQNGYLDFYEFALGSSRLRKEISEQELLIIFQELDKNNDGQISISELRECIEGIDDFCLVEFKITSFKFEDFKQLMKNVAEKMAESTMVKNTK